MICPRKYVRRDTIRSSLEIINANEEIAKKGSKVLYDGNTKPVSYKEGQLVLVILPLIGKPLQAKFFGPYVIEKRIGEVNYVVRTPDRRKSRVVHVNLLKKYIARVTDTPSPIAIVTVVGQVLRDKAILLRLLGSLGAGAGRAIVISPGAV